MLKPSVGVALEGLPYIIIAAFTTFIFAVIGLLVHGLWSAWG